MRSVVSFNEGWSFHEGFEPARAQALQAGETVRLPHTAVELPFNYFDETSYQRAFTYQKMLALAPGIRGPRGLARLRRRDGRQRRLSERRRDRRPQGWLYAVRGAADRHLKQGDNLLTVKIDGSENPAIPPFGGQIDYLSYAGIYRDVWLRVTEPGLDRQRQDRDAGCAGRRRRRSRVRVDLANPQNLPLRRHAIGDPARRQGRRRVATALGRGERRRQPR